MDTHFSAQVSVLLCPIILILSVRFLAIDVDKGLCYLETEEVLVRSREKAPNIESHAINKAPWCETVYIPKLFKHADQEIVVYF